MPGRRSGQGVAIGVDFRNLDDADWRQIAACSPTLLAGAPSNSDLLYKVQDFGSICSLEAEGADYFTARCVWSVFMQKGNQIVLGGKTVIALDG